MAQKKPTFPRTPLSLSPDHAGGGGKRSIIALEFHFRVGPQGYYGKESSRHVDGGDGGDSSDGGSGVFFFFFFFLSFFSSFPLTLWSVPFLFDSLHCAIDGSGMRNHVPIRLN